MISPQTRPACCADATQQEIALAGELLELSHESEITRFVSALLQPALRSLRAALPASSRAAPTILKAALPILKRVAVKALPQIKLVAVRRAPGPEDTDDLGFGVGTRAARAWGTISQRKRPRDVQVAMSLHFVRAARQGARRAAAALLRLLRSGRGISYGTLRRLVYRSLLSAVRRQAPYLLPTMGAMASTMRRAAAPTGRTLPTPRAGRIHGAPSMFGARPTTGSTGSTLPTPRGRVLGVPPRRQVRSARPVQQERVSAGADRW